MSYWPVREGMKTIRQIADEIGVSKQAVYKRYKGKLHTVCDPYAHTEHPIGAVPEQLQEDGVVAVLQATIDMLQGQFEVKDRQIEQQAQTITRLTDALAAAQQTAAAAQALHAGTMQQQILSIEDGDDQVRQSMGNGQKGSCFSRLFWKWRFFYQSYADSIEIIG